MILGKTLEMRCHCSCDLLRLFHFEKMADYLSVMSRLSGQSLHGITLCKNLSFVHYLDLLRRLGNIFEGVWLRGNRAVHQLRLGIKVVIKQCL